MAKSLDPEVKRFHERGLSDEYPFLYFEGIVLKQRDIGGSVEGRSLRPRGGMGEKEEDNGCSFSLFRIAEYLGNFSEISMSRV